VVTVFIEGDGVHAMPYEGSTEKRTLRKYGNPLDCARDFGKAMGIAFLQSPTTR
jgi:hypothetical protein